jgi:hypothetical protein
MRNRRAVYLLARAAEIILLFQFDLTPTGTPKFASAIGRIVVSTKGVKFLDPYLRHTRELRRAPRGEGMRTMFGWLRNDEKQKLDEARELGRVAESANADIDACMKERIYPHIWEMADQVFGDFESPDLPPLVLARSDLKGFVERVDEYVRPTVLPQLRSAVEGWLDVSKQAGIGAEFERLIEHHYEQFKSSLVLAAYQRLFDITDTLKEADDQWRAANPEKAAQIAISVVRSALIHIHDEARRIAANPARLPELLQSQPLWR